MPSETIEGRAAKRIKIQDPEKPLPARRTHIFAPFRTLGLISTTNVPFTYNPSNFQLTTSVGKSLITYSLQRGLNRIWITRPDTPSQITASASWKKYDIAAFGDPRKGEPQGLVIFQRGEINTEIELPTDLDEPLRHITVFGCWIVAAAVSRLEVWNAQTLEHYATLRSFGDDGSNEITSGICPVPAFTNKILVGRKNSWVELWNVKTGKLIHSFVAPSRDCGAVTCLEHATSTLFAIAYANGRLVIRDFTIDIDVLDIFAGTDEAPVTSIAFRKDGLGAGEDGRSDGVMATSTNLSGDVTFWDLCQGGQLSGTLRSAHNPPCLRGGRVRGGVNKIEFLPGQNVMLSCGLDNSLKTWIFDQTPFSPVPRILHFRGGPADQINCLQWLQSDFDGYEGGTKWLLTGSQDRSLWGWSLRKDGQSSELSQGNVRKEAKKRGLLTVGLNGQSSAEALEDIKAPEITCIANCLNRDGGMGALPGKQPMWQKGDRKRAANDAEASFSTGWESVVTGHRGDSFARTWFWGRRRAGRWAFQTSDRTNVSAVAITTCGTFALVGSAGGGIDMFNLQSGTHRQKFPSALSKGQAREVKMQQLKQADSVSKLTSGTTMSYLPGTGRHTKAVTGLVVSPTQSWVASCSLDGKVKFWDFFTGNLTHQIVWNTGIIAMRHRPGSSLIAFSCEDFTIRLIDVDTKKIARQFHGCKNRITDFCWSHDGRWIIAASEDCVIRVWDVPSGNMIDGFCLEKPCIALAMAESNEYLATALEGEIGVNLWINMALFRKHVPARQISEAEIGPLARPQLGKRAGEVVATIVSEAAAADNEDGNISTLATPALDQLESQLMTLSLVPRSKWQTLLHLDEIKSRNKPIEPPKKPENAPFFLPSISDKPSRHRDLASPNEVENRGGHITSIEHSSNVRSLRSTLRLGVETGNYSAYIENLKTLPPSDADLEISSLSTGNGVPGENDLAHFIRALTARREERKDFEMIEVWMKVLMKAHDQDICSDQEVGEAFQKWLDISKRSWSALDTMVSYSSASLHFFINPEA